MNEVLVAVIGLVGLVSVALINRRAVNKARSENHDDHERGYTLLQSIDARTIAIHETVSEHGERLSKVETEVKNLKPQQVTVSSPDGTTTVVDSPHP